MSTEPSSSRFRRDREPSSRGEQSIEPRARIAGRGVSAAWRGDPAGADGDADPGSGHATAGTLAGRDWPRRNPARTDGAGSVGTVAVFNADFRGPEIS